MNDAPLTGVPASRRAMLFSFFAALVPRLWGLTWGLPLKRGHIDEAVVVFYSLRVVSGDPNPRVFFDYPAFFLYALAALFKGVLFVARLWGQAVPSNQDVLSAYMTGDGLLFLLPIARALSALLGALTAAVLCRFGSSRWGLFVGVAAALLWAVNPLAVLHAHYATVDIAAVLLTLLAVERLAVYWEEGRLTDGAWSAFLIGLAAATKYYPGLLVLFLLLAAFLGKNPWRSAAALASVSAATFLAASPYTLLEAASFAQRFSFMFTRLVGAGDGGGLPGPQMLLTLIPNIGAAGCLAAAGGLVLFLRAPSRAEKLLAGVTFSLLLFFGFWRVQTARYALPAYPLLFLAAGRLLAEARRVQRALPLGGLAILLALSVPKMVSCLSLVSVQDTRLTALAWVREAVPAGSRILRFAHTPEFSTRDPFQVTVDWENHKLDKGPSALAVEGTDYVLYGTYSLQDPVPAALSSRFRLVKRFVEPAPNFPHDPQVYIYRTSEKR